MINSRGDYKYRHPNLVAREVAPAYPFSDLGELLTDPGSVRLEIKSQLIFDFLKFILVKVSHSQTSFREAAVRLQGQAGEAGGAL